MTLHSEILENELKFIKPSSFYRLAETDEEEFQALIAKIAERSDVSKLAVTENVKSGFVALKRILELLSDEAKGDDLLERLTEVKPHLKLVYFFERLEVESLEELAHKDEDFDYILSNELIPQVTTIVTFLESVQSGEIKTLEESDLQDRISKFLSLDAETHHPKDEVLLEKKKLQQKGGLRA